MALGRGIQPDLFWGSSVLEIVDMIDAYEQASQTDITRQIEIQFNMADVIANRIARVFADPKKRIPLIYPWTVYPDLFEDKSEEIEEAAIRKDNAEYKENLKAFAERWNKRNG